MHQDELYAVTLCNELEGIGCQSKTVMQIMVECEVEQKKGALLYIKTLQQFKQTGERLWQENPPTHDPEDPLYFIPNESASHKFIDQEEQKKKRKSQGKRKLNQDKCETPKKKKRNDTSAPPVAPVTAVTPLVPATPVTCAGHMTPVTPLGPVTPATCTGHVTPVTPLGPVTPVTYATPVTPATQKGRGKGKGKSSTPKTPSVVTPNSNDYGPLFSEAIEKALLEIKVPNIVMYNNRIQGCYYSKCHHKLDSIFMIPPNNMLVRMKTYREYTRKANGVQFKNTYRSNTFYCLETMECVHRVNKVTHKNHIYMSNFYSGPSPQGILQS